MVTCVDKENMKHLQKTCTPAMDTLTLHGKYIHVFKFFITMVDYDSVLHLTLFIFNPYVSNVSYVVNHMKFCYTYILKVIRNVHPALKC